MIKVAAARMACKVVDCAIQVHGGAGVSGDFPLAQMYVLFIFKPQQDDFCLKFDILLSGTRMHGLCASQMDPMRCTSPPSHTWN